MTKFIKIPCTIDGLFVIEPLPYEDKRGYFFESYNKNEFKNLGIKGNFVQDNHSKSIKGVLRGLHFQLKFPQNKLVRVVKGSIFDVAVDLRKRSPYYKNYFGIYLSEYNKKMFYIPKGFAHGFLSLTEEVEVIYKVSECYYPEYDAGILWNDPDININWPLKDYNIEMPILSEKDRNLPLLRDIT